MKSYMLLILFVVLCLPILLNAEPEQDYTAETLERWKNWDKKLKNGVSYLVKSAMPFILQASEKVNISNQCMKDALQLVSGLRSLKLWAVRMVDSSSKSLDGALLMSMSNFGNFKECVETIAPNKKDPNKPLFSGQYCSVGIQPPLPPKYRRYRIHSKLQELENFTGSELLQHLKEKVHLTYYVPFTLGLCVPSGCSQHDVQQILDLAAEQMDINARVSRCEVKEIAKFDGKQTFIIVITGILAGLVVIGTVLDVCSRKKKDHSKSRCNRMLSSFSAVSNFQRLAFTSCSEEKLRCLNGMKFLSITWVVLGHTYAFPALQLFMHQSILEIEKDLGGTLIQAIVNASEVVDTFFFISGFLVCYLTVKSIKLEKRNFSFVVYVFHRFLRLWPCYAFIVFFAMLTPLMGSGPIFHQTMRENNNCKTYWWRNLLFINNFYRYEEMCMKHSWYLAVDFQLYLASLIVTLPIIRFKKLGVVTCVSVIVASVLYTGVITYAKRVPLLLISEFLADPDDLSDVYLYGYGNTLSRAGPYFIGVLTGYIVVTHPVLKMSKTKLFVGWCVATFSSGSVIFATALWFSGHLPTILAVFVYSAMYKVAWTSGVAWMTLCCVTGHGGVINTFLSWKVWTPLSKLVFLVYLISPLWQTVYLSLYKASPEYTHMIMVTQAFGFLCISYFLALLVNLLLESPLLSLEKILRNNPNQKTELDVNKTEEPNNGFAHSLESDVTHKAVDFDLAAYDNKTFGSYP